MPEAIANPDAQKLLAEGHAAITHRALQQEHEAMKQINEMIDGLVDTLAKRRASIIAQIREEERVAHERLDEIARKEARA